MPARRELESWWPWAGLGLLTVTSVVVLMYQGRGGFFYYDDWNFVLERRDWNTGALLRPHNEHLSLVPAFAYKLLFETAGVDSYSPYRLLLALSHAATLAALFVYARPRVGAALALLLAAGVAVFGAGYLDLLWAFQLGYSVSLLTGVLAFVALDRGTRRGDIAACALMCVSIGSSSVGLCFLVGVAVDVLGRAGRRQRWWIVAVPAVLYALWYLKYHAEGGSGITFDRILTITEYTGQGLAATAGGLAGLPLEYGRVLVVGGIVLLLLGARRYAVVPWRLLAVIAVPLTFWALAAAARSDISGAESVRYLYPSAVFLLLVVAEAALGVRLRRWAVALAALFVLAASLTNFADLRAGGRDLAGLANAVRGPLAGLEVAGPDRIVPEALAEGSVAPQITAGPYFKAIADFGPLVGGERYLLAAPPDVRKSADGFLQSRLIGFVDAEARPAGPAPAVEEATDAAVTPAGPCVRATPQGTGVLTLTVPDAGLVLSGPADAVTRYRRWGDAFDNAPIPLGGPGPRLLRIPTDSGETPWRTQVSFTAPLRVCGA